MLIFDRLLCTRMVTVETNARCTLICSSEKEAQERMKAILSNGKVSIFVSFLVRLDKIRQAMLPHLTVLRRAFSYYGLCHKLISNKPLLLIIQHELPDQEDMPADGVDGFLPYKALALEMLSELAIKRHLHFLTAPFVVNGELSMNR